MNGTTAEDVSFADRYGTLILDQPAADTGTITAMVGDTLQLSGVALGEVTGESYSGNANGGILTINAGARSFALVFDGAFNAGSFALSAGPQVLSSSPPSLDVTIQSGEQTGDAFLIDGSQGLQMLTGSDATNFIDTADAAGAGTVLVDLEGGLVSKGDRLDATVSDIQGVQLGDDTSVVLGLTAGTDLLYGGAGSDSFYNEGGTDIIQGGAGSNAVIGGGGTSIFYGNGGDDVMRGGTGANFMQAGPTAASQDVFYGNGGTDFVYGGAGATLLFGGSGTENLTGGAGYNELTGSSQSASSVNILNGGAGIDEFYAGVGTNLLYETTGTDFFAGSAGRDYVYGGAGKSFVYGGTGTDVVTTGAGDQYVKAGSGLTVFNDTAANLTAGRFDQIDNFAGGKGTNLYLPTADQSQTSFVQQAGGTAVLTQVTGGTAEIFASGATAAVVQADTHFTL